MGFYWDSLGADSITMETSSGSSRIANYELIECTNSFNFEVISVITNFNLISPLTIDREGDYVKLISYTNDHIRIQFISFGNYPGSYIDCVDTGMSVSYVYYPGMTFCLDRSPTIGECQDSTGTMADFKGVVYSPEGVPFTGGVMYLDYPYPHTTVATDGSFSVRVNAKRYFIDEIYMLPPGMYYQTNYLTFFVKPDSTFHHDIITSYYVGINEEKKDDENSITVYPNPASTSATFFINRNELKHSNDLRIVILDDKGIKCYERSINNDESKITWKLGNQISPGMYIYYLYNSDKIIKSGKLVKI